MNYRVLSLKALVRGSVVRVIVIGLSVEFSLSMSEIGALNCGDGVELHRIDALPGQSFAGKVARHSAGLDEETRMMRVEVDLENSDGRLRPGFFGYVRVCLEPEAAD